MIVREDNGRRVDLQCPLHYYTGMDGSTVDGALEHFLEGQHAMPIVEIDSAEHFVLVVRKFETQVRCGIRGAGQIAASHMPRSEYIEGLLDNGSLFGVIKLGGPSSRLLQLLFQPSFIVRDGVFHGDLLNKRQRRSRSSGRVISHGLG